MPDASAQSSEADYPPEQTAVNAQNVSSPPPRNVMAEVIERHERVTNRVKNAKK